jgi:hypothetical protein
MSVFEFILIPASIIAGLGITELLSGVVRMLRGDLKAGALHSLWVLLVFLLQVQWLWSQWSNSERGEWAFPEFALLLLEPIGLYLVAALLFPAENSRTTLDEHILAHRRSIFPIAGATLALFLISNLIGPTVPTVGKVVPRVVGILGCGVLTVTGSRRIHWAILTLFLLMLPWYIYAFTFRVG